MENKQPDQKLPEIIHESWYPYLQPLFNDYKMHKINHDVLPKCRFYPDASQIFRVFSMPLSDIKIVILGQDPYYNGTANGLAFAVNKEVGVPKSLKIIRDEIINSRVERDTYVNIDDSRWKTLFHWRGQGIFLLNTALTVGVGESGSHTGIWQWFTRDVIKIISTEVKPVWLLWGAKAKSFKDYIYQPKILFKDTTGPEQVTNTNVILEADHPAAETYQDSKAKFSGCNHFNLCNKVLKARNQTVINW